MSHCQSQVLTVQLVLVLPAMCLSLSVICHRVLPAVLYASDSHTVLSVNVTRLELIQLKRFCYTCGYTVE